MKQPQKNTAAVEFGNHKVAEILINISTTSRYLTTRIQNMLSVSMTLHRIKKPRLNSQTLRSVGIL